MGLKCGLVNIFKLLSPRAPHGQHNLIVQPVELFPDSLINLCQAKKGAVSKWRNYPAFDILNPIFHSTFIFRFLNPAGKTAN